MRASFLFITVLLVLPAVLYGTTLHVPSDFPTIQQAIDAAVNGDTVLVQAGTYVEKIDFLGKAITVLSSDGPATAIIDGNKSGSVVSFQLSEGRDSVLDGFTVRNGTGTYLVSDEYYLGGGIYCNGASPTIRNNIIKGNAVPQAPTYVSKGGGIGCIAGSPEISGNVITGNFVDSGNGGAIALIESSAAEIRDNTITDNAVDFCGAGIFCQHSSSTAIERNFFSGNKAGNNKGSAGRGGAIGCYHASPVISDNNITKNTAESGNGGGIYLSYSEAEVTGNKITKNMAYGEGGGIACWWESSPLIHGNIIDENEAKYGGGGIYWDHDSFPAVTDNMISRNRAIHGPGGGIYYYGTPPVVNGGGGLKDRVSSAYVTGNEIRENAAEDGGGIYCFDYGLLTFSANLIVGNSAGKTGGGVAFLACSPFFWNNTVLGNDVGTFGGGIYLVVCESHLCNNTVTGNTAVGEGGGLFCSNFSAASVSNSILWNNSAAAGPEIAVAYSTLSIHCSDVTGGLADVYLVSGGIINWGTGMIDAVPLFADPAGGDFHLQYPSPCRDAGDNASVTIIHDFEGDPRIANGTVDMGMDEFHTHLYVMGDMTPGGSIEGKMVGNPGSTPLGLFLGSGVVIPGVHTPWGWFYLEAPYVVIGFPFAMPAGGVLVLPATLPGVLPPPYDVPMQAYIGPKLSNLFVIQVR